MRTALTTPLAVASLLAAGCGSQTNYANDPRPPAPIAVSASVANGRVTVSPGHVGAGPIRFMVANLTKHSHDVIVDPVDASGAGARSGPVNPQGTAQVQLDVHQGTYRVRASDGGITPSILQVGHKRQSAQNQLLQP
jgi:hypothetical protein